MTPIIVVDNASTDDTLNVAQSPWQSYCKEEAFCVHAFNQRGRALQDSRTGWASCAGYDWNGCAAALMGRVLAALDIPHRLILLWVHWLHRDDGVPSLVELRVSVTCPIQWSAAMIAREPFLA